MKKVKKESSAALTGGGGSIAERVYRGKKAGIWISYAVSLISILLFTLVRTIKIRDAESLLLVLKQDSLKDSLSTGYSTLNILSFVYRSGNGKQGAFAMAIFAVTVVTVILNIVYLLKFKKYSNTGNNIKIYEAGQYAMVFNILLSLSIIGFCIYSNAVLGLVNVFYHSFLLFVIIIISVAGFVLIKQLEAPERNRYKEPGFFLELKRNWILFVLLLPAILYFIVNSYLPMAGIYFAFEKFNFRDGLWTSPFVMFDNFEYIWKADLLKLVRNTVLYNLVFIILGHLFKILTAILISQITSKWFKRLNQTLIFMPHFVSYVLLNVIVYNLLTYETGAVNTFLSSIGLGRIDFYNNPGYWPFILVFFELWKGVGYGSVVYLAAILGIDRTYYEAAEVDGANVFQQIRYITLPLLKTTFIILVLFSLGNIMRGQFDLFYQTVGNNGLLYNTTDIFDTYVYRLTMTNPLNNGLGTAAGLFQSIFGFVTIVLTNYIVKRKNDDYALF
ncbi:ABC transporter permease subunit [Anaerocolumna sp. AGMB13025]|uniref:ABC transporter permease n=1 Tax=Anaerocolumna sp. AGMB13025 TaxID=3039116 RepID=UPI00241C7D44|nr:ABC transporter permease subunit [Anaerocolumna sp. AGMB13025]WFR55746.1 ABC transporter permease subunit [Anaerocolumna sp. AGMB13025]